MAFSHILNPDKERWNASVHHPLQTYEWAMARREHGVKVFFIAQEDYQQAFLVTKHRPNRYIPFALGYVQRGPLPTKEMLAFLKDFAHARKLAFIKFEPNQEYSMFSQWQKTIHNCDVPILPSAHPLFVDWTMKLDLTVGEEELKKNLKPKNRYNIGLAQRKGVVVREGISDADFQTFLDLYFDTTARQGYSGHTRTYHEIIYKHLKNNIAHILLAEYESEALGGYELFLWDNILYYPYGGSSNNHRNLMANNLIMWEAIRFGIQHGAHIFDMWGAMDPSDYAARPDHPWAGFTRFKEQYNAQFVRMLGSWDMVIDPIPYRIYSTLWPVRKKILKLLGK